MSWFVWFELTAAQSASEDGAWVTLLLIPALLLVFAGVRHHYRVVWRELSTEEPLDAQDLKRPLALLLMRNWNSATHHNDNPVRYLSGGMDEFLFFARALSDDEIARLYEQRRPPS